MIFSGKYWFFVTSPGIHSIAWEWECTVSQSQPPAHVYLHTRIPLIPFKLSHFALGFSTACVHWVIESHDDVIKWKHFPRYWPFVRGIHRSTVNSPHKGQWRGALRFSLICTWINGWVNKREAGDLRRKCAHYDATVMNCTYHTSQRHLHDGHSHDNPSSCGHKHRFPLRIHHRPPGLTRSVQSQHQTRDLSQRFDCCNLIANTRLWRPVGRSHRYIPFPIHSHRKFRHGLRKDCCRQTDGLKNGDAAAAAAAAFPISIIRSKVATLLIFIISSLNSCLMINPFDFFTWISAVFIPIETFQLWCVTRVRYRRPLLSYLLVEYHTISLWYAHARNEKHGGLELRLIYEISPHMDYQNRWKTACALITNLRNL